MVKSFLTLLIIAGLASASSLWGTAYDSQFDPVSKVLVHVNSTPFQQLVSQNGAYAFTLPQGSYKLTATKGNISVSENVSLPANGDFRFDLIFLPDLPTDISDLDDAMSERGIPTTDLPEHGTEIPWFLWILSLAILALASWFFYKQHRFKMKNTATQEVRTVPTSFSGQTPANPRTVASVTPDQKRVLKTLESFNNRAPQKELRKALTPWGEAKVSLELTELEDNGFIRKIRKGRGNIIRRA